MDEYMRLLHQFDELGGLGDYPADVSINANLPGDVKRLQISLEEILGLEFELQAGNMFYDAAFYGNLYIRKDVYGRECLSQIRRIT